MKPLAAHVAQAGHLALPLIPLFSPPSPHIQSVCTSCRLQISLQIWAHLPPLPSQSHLLPLLSCHHHLRLGLKNRTSLLHLASSQRKPIGTCLSEGRCATTRDSKRCFQANTSLSFSGCAVLPRPWVETPDSAPPGDYITWVLAQAGTHTDARRKYKETRLTFFYVPLRLVSSLVILRLFVHECTDMHT